ncbi:MAG: hypothetical protein P9M14_02475 [Candidatus Alcyoniella australis]|nr:hypothetical protein [Candidatus Alcyoniella australis]
MSRKHRLVIMLCAFGPFLIATGLLQLFTILDLNPRDPVFGVDKGDYAVYRIEGQPEPNEFTVATTDATAAMSFVAIDGAVPQRLFKLVANGSLLGISGDANSIFWVPIDNPVLRAAPEIRQWRVRDVAGWFGALGNDYDVKVDRTFILWDSILQSQASYATSLYDNGGKRVGEIVFDETCGLAFRLKSYVNGMEARLIDTNFPISRNRNWLHMLHALVIILVGLMAWRWAAAGKPVELLGRRHTVSLILSGALCIFLDTQVDIWEPFLFSKEGMILLHALVALALTLLWGRFSLPAWIELIVIVMFGYVERTGISPMAAFFPGISLSWLGMLLAQTPSATKESQSSPD